MANMTRAATLLMALVLLAATVANAGPFGKRPVGKMDRYYTRAGKAFLATKASLPGAVTLPSGLVFEVLKHGTGDRAPAIDQECSMNYVGSLHDGTVFDSSEKAGGPVKFRPNQVIPAWTEALQLMRAGDKWRIYVPQELGYGKAGAGRAIPPFATLQFEMELVEIPDGGKGRTLEQIKEVIEKAKKKGSDANDL